MKEYVSEKGSTVKVTGKYSGIFTIDFDWFEEGACVEAHPEFNNDDNEPAIIACCECCEDSPFVVPLDLIKITMVIPV